MSERQQLKRNFFFFFVFIERILEALIEERSHLQRSERKGEEERGKPNLHISNDFITPGTEVCSDLFI